MINVAIVDDFNDDAVILTSALREIEDDFKVRFNTFIFNNGESFLMNYVESKFDLVFLDIELGNENGIEVAKKLRDLDKTIIIIFVTNMSKYATAGYEVDALDYIIKPVNKYALSLKMSRIISRLQKNQTNSIVIKSINDEIIKVPVERIKYLEVDGHYIIYHTTDGEYKEYVTLKQAEKKINSSKFIRCNRGFLVNLSYVDSVKKDTCLIGKDALIVSRPQKNSFMKAFIEYLNGEQ